MNFNKQFNFTFILSLALCLGFTSCSSDEEEAENNQEPTERLMLAGEWQIDGTQTHAGSGRPLEKLRLYADGSTLPMDQREYQVSWGNRDRWVYDPDQHVLAFDVARQGMGGTLYNLYTYEVKEVSYDHLVLKYLYDGSSAELHYKKVINDTAPFVKTKYSRKDFYGTWYRKIKTTKFDENNNPSPYTETERYTFSNDWLETFKTDWLYGDTNLKFPGKFWLYDPLQNILEIGTTQWTPMAEDGTRGGEVNPEMVSGRKLYTVYSLTHDRMILHHQIKGYDDQVYADTLLREK